MNANSSTKATALGRISLSSGIPDQGRHSGMPSDAFPALRTSRPAATRSRELVPDVSPMSRVQVLGLVAHLKVWLHDVELLEVGRFLVNDRRPTVPHAP